MGKRICVSIKREAIGFFTSQKTNDAKCQRNINEFIDQSILAVEFVEEDISIATKKYY